VDAVLTNGADVTVTTSPGTVVPPGSTMSADLARTPGVQHVEAIQHRFAYVGSDLQDLYGVDPATILAAGRLQNAYFEGGTAHDLITKLASQPDSVLVSAETVRDFQLLPGDLLRLRLQNGVTKQYVEVPFHYVGVVNEFPTAPSDTFLLANADYVAQATGSDAVGASLLDTGGQNVLEVAHRVRDQVGTSATVTDIGSSRKIIGSSLTAVDLTGGATGLSLWLGLTERKRNYAIAAALGAKSRDLGGFVLAETAAVTLTGLALGGVLALTLSVMLVKVLHGVFDPPPEHPLAPTAYLLLLLALTLVSAGAAAMLTLRAVRSPDLEILRLG